MSNGKKAFLWFVLCIILFALGQYGKSLYYSGHGTIGKIRYNLFPITEEFMKVDTIIRNGITATYEDDKIVVKLNDNKTLDVDVSVYMYAIRTLTETLMLKDNAIDKAFRIRIKNECEYQKIDPNKFCLDRSFSDRILLDEGKIKGYEEELSGIQTEINRLTELNRLFDDGSPEARQKIASEIKELNELFGE